MQYGWLISQCGLGAGGGPTPIVADAGDIAVQELSSNPAIAKYFISQSFRLNDWLCRAMRRSAVPPITWPTVFCRCNVSCAAVLARTAVAAEHPVACQA